MLFIDPHVLALFTVFFYSVSVSDSDSPSLIESAQPSTLKSPPSLPGQRFSFSIYSTAVRYKF